MCHSFPRHRLEQRGRRTEQGTHRSLLSTLTFKHFTKSYGSCCLLVCHILVGRSAHSTAYCVRCCSKHHLALAVSMDGPTRALARARQ